MMNDQQPTQSTVPLTITTNKQPMGCEAQLARQCLFGIHAHFSVFFLGTLTSKVSQTDQGRRFDLFSGGLVPYPFLSPPFLAHFPSRPRHEAPP